MSNMFLLIALGLIGAAQACAPIHEHTTVSPGPSTTHATVSSSSIPPEEPEEDGDAGGEDGTDTRRKRSVADDVVIILKTVLPYNQAQNEAYMLIVRQKLKSMASDQSVDTSVFHEEPINYSNFFATKITIPEASDDCDSVKKFVENSVKTVGEISGAQIICGEKLPITINKI